MAIKDGLEIAEDLVNFSKTKSEFYYLAEEIENDLLNGKIELSKDGDVVFQSNKAKSKSKRLPIHLTASIVKSLSSLVFYLKYIAEHNELIIIDEPELNLHPNNQVIIARVFAKLINNGFRLLVSTHSDYIVRELNNLIMASTLDKKTLIENKLENYQNGYGINKADIGAYLFNYENPNSRKVNVKPIKIDKFGFEISTIDKTVDELNFNSNILYNLTIDHE
jgi:predicted ATPase